ncbi:transposable element Tcb2 transposase [Trichonephila clavipes]|nr:transposable element Tcb2 transposase [Trichonephila clavipes]
MRLLEPKECAWLKYIWDRGPHILCVLPLTPTHRRIHLEWSHAQGNSTAAKWNQVVFSDESRFNLISDDNRVCVWRPQGECLNTAFHLQQHTTSTTGVMICCVTAYFTRSYLVLVHGTITSCNHMSSTHTTAPRSHFQNHIAQSHTANVSQDCFRTFTILPWPARSSCLSPNEDICGAVAVRWYVHNILQPHVFPLMQRLPGAIFQQDNAWTHMARMSQDRLRAVAVLQ